MVHHLIYWGGGLAKCSCYNINMWLFLAKPLPDYITMLVGGNKRLSFLEINSFRNKTSDCFLSVNNYFNDPFTNTFIS